MLYGAVFSILVFAVMVQSDCDVSVLGESQKGIASRTCQLEAEVQVIERALQEVMQKIETGMTEDPVLMQKRKNEFIRFGKRGERVDKRKNEFIRFGKRKNEFIRFGRSTTDLEDVLPMNKRKNEFIRFG